LAGGRGRLAALVGSQVLAQQVSPAATGQPVPGPAASGDARKERDREQKEEERRERNESRRERRAERRRHP
jgi:hypothetical protein